MKIRLIALAAAAALAGCSSVDNFLQGDKVDYKSAAAATRNNGLDVPPDLSQLAKDNRFALPTSGTVSASSYGQATRVVATAGTDAPSAVLPQFPGMKIVRLGEDRYLEVDRTPDALWNPIRDFWQEQGFRIASESPEAGVMETDWAENRSKLPQDVVRRTLGKMLDSLYDTGERDKFRTRLERTADGKGTDIYITHRGLKEVLVGQLKDDTRWEPRKPDPALEDEFLRKLMVRLGAKPEAAKQQMAAAEAAPAVPAAPPAAKLVGSGATQSVEVFEPFDRAWRRVGVALDRSGFTVEDRDRTKGVYYVRYVDPSQAQDDRGFFSRLFGGDAKIDPTRYEVRVKGNGSNSQVTVAPSQPPKVDATGKILAMLADQLK
ncbi:MAG: outer membrane protein assembly factor BamC [Betaproteobacteria bacterium]|nr:outer membrane protein assembly factor BamC [Betaproteobacteria bacterium]